MTRARIHHWASRPLNAEDRALWTCEYCGAEAECEAYKPSPGSAPMRETYYRESGGAWRQIDRVPECTDTVRVPLSVRGAVMSDRRVYEVAEELGVPWGTVNSWRHRLRRASKGLPPRLTQEERAARAKRLAEARAAAMKDKPEARKIAWSSMAKVLRVGPQRAKAALEACGISGRPVSRDELLAALAEWDKRPAVRRGLRSVQSRRAR